MSLNKLITPKQVKFAYETLSEINAYYGNLRYKILSTAIPEYIYITNDNVTFKYSQAVENCLKEIDKMEKASIKDFEELFETEY
jgi:hypothetical protein